MGRTSSGLYYLSDRTTGDFPEVAAAEPRELRVSLLVYHLDGVKAVPLEPEHPVVVGRAPEADITVRDEEVSRQHARFGLDSEGIWVEDLGSKNGTQINGMPIEHSHLLPGQEISMGPVRVLVHLLGPSAPKPRGLLNHDEFMSLLQYEIQQSKTFGRDLGLMMVRAMQAGPEYLQRLSPVIQQHLRPVDRIGIYSPDTVEVLLPEICLDRARQLARAIALGEGPSQPGAIQLLCGVGLYPAAAASSEELITVVRNALQQADPQQPVRSMPAEPTWIVDGGTWEHEGASDEEMVVSSPAMKQVRELIERFAPMEAPVLIVGETGVGKELVAREIHQHSNRRDEPLKCINCGALPIALVESLLFGHVKGAFTGALRDNRGVFEMADQGTLLLDEIGELPIQAQVALLRVLDQGRLTRVGSTREITVNVRVIAATNRDLEAMCQAGAFRRDLLYRINTVTLQIPPLRDRREAILHLSKRFIRQASQANRRNVQGLHPDAARLLEHYSWPGNVRELRNMIDRAVALAKGDQITASDLPEKVRALGGQVPPRSQEGEIHAALQQSEGLDFKTRIERIEAALIIEALREANWNQSEAARRLRIPLRTMTRKMQSYSIAKLGFGFRDDEPPR